MNFLEKDLEQIIWEADNYLLQEKGLWVVGKKIRQLRIGNYGVSDLITIKKDYETCFYSQKTIPYLDITIYELKKEKVGIGAFLQSLKYCKGIKSYLELKKPNLKFKLNIILIAKEVDLSGEFIYLTDLITPAFENFGFLDSIGFYSFKYEINGIEFKKHENYDLIHKGF